MEIHYNTRVFVNKTQVLIRIRWSDSNKKTKETTLCTGVSAEIDKWNKMTGRAKQSTTHHVGNRTYTSRQINYRIEHFLEVIECVIKEYESKNLIPTTEDFKNNITPRLGRTNQDEKKSDESNDEKTSLEEAFRAFLQIRPLENNWGEKTHHKYKEMLDHCLACMNKSISKASTSDFDNHFMTKLKGWYIENKYSNTTIQKHFRNVKGFLRWCKQNGYDVKSEVLSYKLVIEVPKKTVVFLKGEELKKLSEYKFPESKEYLERVVDGFCFCCYTALRYSDLANLKWSNVVNDEYIEFYTLKTKDLLRVPLIPAAKRLINKYRGKDYTHVFPVISNQKMNDYLKEAAEIVGLDREIMEVRFEGSKRIEKTNKLYETISCHDARRTFVCNSLALGIPPSVVQKITGHSDLHAMAPYVNTDLSVIAQELSKWDTSATKKEIIELINKSDDQDELDCILEFIKKKKTVFS